MLILRLMNRLVELMSRVSWPTIGFIFVTLYALGAIMLAIAEPVGSAFHSVADYSWWFLVTITTVGYGDLAPTTPLGRLAAAFIMVFGIGTIGVVLGKVGEAFFEIGRKRMRGQARLNERNHIVILGYNSGETEHMIEEIVADPDWADRPIVLCSAVQEENPIPDRVRFVRGPLSSDDVMTRACVAEANVLIIQSHDDSTAIVTAIAASSVNPDAHIVVGLTDAENEKHILRINSRIECVVPLRIPMTVQALQDPGITRVMQTLLSNVRDDVFYRIDVPRSEDPEQSWPFGELLETFKKRYEAILVGVSESYDPGAAVRINPPSDFRVRPGMALFYIATRRLSGLDWQAL
jgi:voltage-gated potassium channel